MILPERKTTGRDQEMPVTMEGLLSGEISKRRQLVGGQQAATETCTHRECGLAGLILKPVALTVGINDNISRP